MSLRQPRAAAAPGAVAPCVEERHRNEVLILRSDGRRVGAHEVGATRELRRAVPRSAVELVGAAIHATRADGLVAAGHVGLVTTGALEEWVVGERRSRV